MANKRIDQLPPSGNDLKGTDLLAVWSDNKTERITLDAVASYTGFTSQDTYIVGGVFVESASTITFTNNKNETFNVTGITSENTFLTGGTINGNTIILENNDGNDVIISGFVNGDTYWTSGSTGNGSVKQVNDTTIDALNDYATAMGNSTISSGQTSISSGLYTYSNGIGSFAGGHNPDFNNLSNTAPTGQLYGQTFTGITVGDKAYYIIASGDGSLAYGGSDAEGPLYVSGDYSQVFGKNNVNTGNQSAVFGDGNYIETTNNSILYGRGNYLTGTLNSVNEGNLVGGRDNAVTGTSSTYNVVSGFENKVGGSYGLINGRNHKVSDSAFIILNGLNNTVNAGQSIIYGNNHNVKGSFHLVGGSSNTISEDSFYSFVTGGDNTHNAEEFGSIINGVNSELTSNANYSTIVGGEGQYIGSPYSSILGGTNNKVNNGINRSVVIGGEGITATTSDTVYVPKLNINTLSTGVSVNNLGIDSNGNVVTGTTSSSFFEEGGDGNNSLKDVKGSHNITNSGVFSIIGGGTSNTIGTNSNESSIIGGRNNTIDNSDGSSIIGGRDNTVSAGGSSIISGYECDIIGPYSLGTGFRTRSTNQFNFTQGVATVATGPNAMSFGDQTSGTSLNSISSGERTLAAGENSQSHGKNTSSSGVTSTTFGEDTTILGHYSHLFGYNNTITGDYSFGSGGDNVLEARYSSVNGLQNTVTGWTSHAEGERNVVGGRGSHAEGLLNNIFGEYSHAEGRVNTINSDHSHAEGEGHTINADWGHAEGKDNVISVGGGSGHVEGFDNEVGGGSAHAQGTKTKALGAYSHSGGGSEVFGSFVVASGRTSFAHFGIPVVGSDTGFLGSHADYSAILGGIGHNIDQPSNNSIILGGRNNKVLGVVDSAVIGGSNLTATTSNTVYVPQLNIGSLVTGTTSVNSLGIDANGNVIQGDVAVNVSPTTLVVSNSGDDNTAEKGSLSKQYSSLVYAANQAVSGDTIYVAAGDYAITDSDWSTYGGQSGTTLYRDGVTWYFEPGSVVTNEVSKSNNPCIFYVTSSNQSCEVYGRATFINQYENVDAYASLINGFNDGGVGSDLVFECQNFDSSIFYYAIWVEMFKNADIKIHGTIKWESSWGMTLSPADTVEAENLSLFVNHIDLTEENGFYPMGLVFWCYGNGGALTGHNVTFEFNTIETVGQSTTSPQIWINTDDSYINVKGKKFINTRTDGTSTVSSLVGVRGAHNSNVNIHIDDCVATSLRTNKSLIMLHNNDSEETTENNNIKISGRYEALQGSVLSTNEGGLVRNSNTYVLNGEFVSNTQYVANFEDNDTDIEISGELRCNYTGSTGYGIRSIVSDSNILLRDLEIVTQGADAINSTVATEIDIIGTLTTNTDVNSNVTLRGIHNLNNIAKPDDLTVRGREILSQTVGTISTTGSTLDWSLSNNFDYTLATGTTFTFTGDTDGQTIVMSLTQDGTGGHTVTWPAGVKWAAGGTEPTMTSASGSTDVYTLIKINGTVYGSYIQDFQ